MNTKKLLGTVIGASVALVVVVLGWRSDPVQETLRPEKYWMNKVLLIELDVDYMRNKVAECSASAQKVQAGAKGSEAPAGDSAARLATMSKLCSSYDDDLKAAVESLLGAKKKLKDAKS